MASAGKHAYAVVWPRGEKTIEVTPLASRLESIEGKTVAFVWDYLFRGDEVFAILAEGLRERYGDLRFIGHEEFGSTHGGDEHAVIAVLADRLKAVGANAVVSGMGC
ncbi:MAG TPA: hypothetical protein VE631_01785 [Alphaproteobacteria bacterium]|jgi:hypothetical protein|nr:hypothetical protein [Alphaproteobacteria bacterium]